MNMPKTLQYDAFVAYASADSYYAEQLYALLTALGYRIFLDSKALRAGKLWMDEIRGAQENSRLMLVLISDGSDRAFFQGAEIIRGIELARDGVCELVPVYLTDKRGRAAVRHELTQFHSIFWEPNSSLLSVAVKIEEVLKSSARPEAWQHEIVAETVVIVTGCHHMPEIYDRPCAYNLKAAIDLMGRSLEREFLYSVVMGDIWFLEHSNIQGHANLVSIGSPAINHLSQIISEKGKIIRSSKNWQIVLDQNRWALFGELAEHTREAVDSFRDRDLQGFLGQRWPKIQSNRFLA